MPLRQSWSPAKICAAAREKARAVKATRATMPHLPNLQRMSLTSRRQRRQKKAASVKRSQSQMRQRIAKSASVLTLTVMKRPLAVALKKRS